MGHTMTREETITFIIKKKRFSQAAIVKIKDLIREASDYGLEDNVKAILGYHEEAIKRYDENLKLLGVME